MSKTVCVIGAGVGGISAIKSCLEEGLQPTCFEGRSDIGGTWFYDRNEKTGSARVYESLITNVSKEASCYSDFPYPKDFPPYFSHTKVVEYLKSYVEHFDLEKHIFCNIRVLLVEQTKVEGRHKWAVTTRPSESLNSENDETQHFDCIIVCTGENNSPQMPTIDGLQTRFTGNVIHSSTYDAPEDYKGKRVVVIGLGNSGADIVVDISRQADRAVISTRSGGWIAPRCFEALDPHASIMINDELPARIMSGNVIVRPEIVSFTEREVLYKDGRKEEVDCVICASGYETKFPFISDDILPDGRCHPKLFEWIFPFEFHAPETIAVVGLIPASGGSAFPAFECQTRYVAQVMAGITKLPSITTMKANYEERMRELPDGKDSTQFRIKLGFGYQDRLARLGGFYPNFWRLLFRSPILALKIYVGPFLSYHYRLSGRHSWSGAAERIYNAIPNTTFALRNV